MSGRRHEVTVAYVTHRDDPRFQWFADSLARQLEPAVELEVILVDGLHSTARAAAFGGAVAGRFPFRCVPAKPTPLNGAHRLTRRDLFAAASARNTAIVHATKPYVAFVDDASVLMPGWLKEVVRAAHLGYVVAGSYEKRWSMAVEDGELVASDDETTAVDSRRAASGDEALRPVDGGDLFGCSFGAPREFLVAVNGFDEICDPTGGEDYHLGLRLQWAGLPIYYSRRMLTVESEEAHRQPSPLVRVDPVTTAAAYARALERFGVGRRSTDGPCDRSHFILDLLHGTRSVRSLGNCYDLAALTASDLESLPGRFPESFVFDGRSYAEL